MSDFEQLTLLITEIESASFRAPDDIPSPDKIRSLLKDLREARQAKSREGLKMIDHNELSVSVCSRSCCISLMLSCLVTKFELHGDQ